MTNEQIEIQRLIALLESRREEYKVFGMTGSDAEYDSEIRRKIKTLLSPTPQDVTNLE